MSKKEEDIANFLTDNIPFDWDGDVDLSDKNKDEKYEFPYSFTSKPIKIKRDAITRNGKKIFDSQSSELYSENMNPQMRVLKSFKKPKLIDSNGWQYYDAHSEEFQMQWIKDKLNSLTFDRNSDRIYWISKPRSLNHLIPEVDKINKRKFKIDEETVIEAWVVENSSGKTPVRSPYSRSTAWVVLRFNSLDDFNKSTHLSS